MAKEKAKSRGSAKREATRRANGYWARRRAITGRNILGRLDRHIGRNPRDKVAKAARSKRLGV